MRKKIAPRLANGDSREKLYGRLPYDVKLGLQTRAAANNSSVAWEIEQMVIAMCKLRQPKYVKPKTWKAKKDSFGLNVVPMRRRA